MNATNSDITSEPLNYVLPRLKGETEAIMLFGSYAREDFTASSDIDVLQLVPQQLPAYKVGTLNVAVYDKKTLSKMAKEGSLFILHLLKEGHILSDRAGTLRKCLTSYRTPESYEPLFRQLRTIAKLLDVTEEGYLTAYREYHETALFVLRSFLYATQAMMGKPIFSIRRIAYEMDDSQLLRFSETKNITAPDWKTFVAMRNRIIVELGTDIRNQFLTPEALVVNSFEECPAIIAFGLKIISKEDITPTYGFPLI